MNSGIKAVAAALGIVAGGLCWLSAPASAAPAAGAVTGGTGLAASETTAVENVRWVRRCWRGRWGHLHCRRVWRPGFYYYRFYGPRHRYWHWNRRWHGHRHWHRGHYHGRGFRGGHVHRHAAHRHAGHHHGGHGHRHR
jgi:hypothetical protein